MKKLIALAVAFSLFAILLSACSGSTSSEGAETTTGKGGACAVVSQSGSVDSNGVYELTGSVKNGTGAAVAFLKVNVKFLDAAGNVLDEQSATCDPDVVDPGKTAKFAVGTQAAGVGPNVTKCEVTVKYQ